MLDTSMLQGLIGIIIGAYFILAGKDESTRLAGWTIVVGLISFAIFSESGRIPRRQRA